MAARPSDRTTHQHHHFDGPRNQPQCGQNSCPGVAMDPATSPSIAVIGSTALLDGVAVAYESADHVLYTYNSVKRHQSPDRLEPDSRSRTRCGRGRPDRTGRVGRGPGLLPGRHQRAVAGDAPPLVPGELDGRRGGRDDAVGAAMD